MFYNFFIIYNCQIRDWLTAIRILSQYLQWFFLFVFQSESLGQILLAIENLQHKCERGNKVIEVLDSVSVFQKLDKIQVRLGQHREITLLLALQVLRDIWRSFCFWKLKNENIFCKKWKASLFVWTLWFY